MRDVPLNELADELADQLMIPKLAARKMTNHMFRYIFKVMKSKTDRVMMFGSDVPQVYTDYDVKKMCAEMIEDKRVGYSAFFRHTRIPRIVRRYIKSPRSHLLD